jgi:hypothetical protein
MSAALRLQSSLLLRLLLLLLVMYPSDASFALVTRARSINSNLLGLLVVGPKARRVVRIDSTVLLLHGSGGEGDDNNKDAVEEDLPRRSNRKEEENKIDIKFVYPIKDQIVDTIGRIWNTFIRCVILVASIGIILNLSGLAIDIDEKGIQLDTIQHMRELKQFKAEYENA